MSDQLSKPLFGQYKFSRESDRVATCNDMKLQGGAAQVITPAANVVTIDATLGCLFKATNNAATTITINGMVDGQIVNVLLINSNSGSAIQPTFTAATGTITTLAASATGLYTVYKVGSSLYVKGDDL